MPEATSVAEYISAAAKPAQPKLREMRALIAAAAPGATQSLKWGRVAFCDERILVVFGAFKNHIGFFPTPAAIREFKKELVAYECSSATVRFPLDRPLPKALIRRMVKFRVAQNRDSDAKWRS